MSPTPIARLARLPDWPERLADHIQAHRAAGFAWGRHDCVTFAAGAVAAITGQQLLQPAAQWASSRTAAAALQCHGGLAAAVDKLLPRLASPLLAQRGDLVLVQADLPGQAARRPRRQFLAVADSVGWWAPGRHQLQIGGLSAAVIAWGVAHG